MLCVDEAFLLFKISLRPENWKLLRKGTGRDSLPRQTLSFARRGLEAGRAGGRTEKRSHYFVVLVSLLLLARSLCALCRLLRVDGLVVSRVGFLAQARSVHHFCCGSFTRVVQCGRTVLVHRLPY